MSLAETSDGVIINADSQQLYRDLRILTARPSEEDEARIPHRLYGVLPGDEPASAGKWLKLAKMEIDWVLSQGKRPIVVGGTGLYLKALMQGIAEIPDVAPEVRQQAMNDYEAMGKDAFAARLREADPAFFTRLKVYDRQRLIRAYEVWLGTGRPLSWWQAQAAAPLYPPESFELIKIELPREELYRRCDARFLQMVEQGAVEEVRGIEELRNWGNEEKPSSIPQFLNSSFPLAKIIGVRELSAHIAGEITLKEAIEKAQQATRNYAKRQLTWFRNQL